jgi:hypothetical protein
MAKVSIKPAIWLAILPRESAIIPHPVIFPVTKKAGTMRIFVLGESAAAGTPDPSFGFARILEVMLRQRHPGTNFEVINAAMRGINSHIVRRIAKECLQYQPDLLLVYMATMSLSACMCGTQGIQPRSRSVGSERRNGSGRRNWHN